MPKLRYAVTGRALWKVYARYFISHKEVSQTDSKVCSETEWNSVPDRCFTTVNEFQQLGNLSECFTAAPYKGGVLQHFEFCFLLVTPRDFEFIYATKKNCFCPNQSLVTAIGL